MALFYFIEGFYNPHPRHSALGYLSPIEYERNPPRRRESNYEELDRSAHRLAGQVGRGARRRSLDQRVHNAFRLALRCERWAHDHAANRQALQPGTGERSRYGTLPKAKAMWERASSALRACGQTVHRRTARPARDRAMSVYIPEFNPIEYLRSYWKHHELPNCCPSRLRRAELSGALRATPDA